MELFSAFVKEVGYKSSLDIPNFIKETQKSGIQDFKEANQPLYMQDGSTKIQDITRRSILPVEGHGGTWSGERGNSDWVPDGEYIPPDKHGTNPNQLSWKDILEKYEVDSIAFKDGEPDFSEVSRGTVEIEDFSPERDYNFSQADEELAKQKGCSPEDIKDWRKENKYTWHERNDCKTMDLVPTEIHGNIPHSGGISIAKAKLMEFDIQHREV